MSVMNQSAEDQMECPLCMEPLEVDDLNFYPCTCGYQICRFCWNRIREGDSGLCPACRKAYPENPADFTPLSQEQVAAIKTEKKAREQKRRNKTLESRKALANVRVVQNNLVFVVGLPVRLADPETLKRQEYFGKYGKIHKVVINQSTTYAGTQGPSASAYVTYVTSADALRAIQGVNNVTLDGRVLKASLGTTKYCAHFMKNQPCPKVDCMYLHDLGDPKASFTKEEMHAGLHQVYEKKLHNQLLAASQPNSTGNSSSSTDRGSTKDGNFVPSSVVTTSNITIVNSKSSKKEPSSSGSSNCSSLSNGNKEAWPSLGSSPPNDSPHRKQNSPKLSAKSQENGVRSSSESSSPTQPPTKTKHNKENHSDNKSNKSNKDNSTNNNKKSKSDKKHKNKETPRSDTDDKIVHELNQRNEIEELPKDKYMSNELEEIESDRHSLLDGSDDDIHGLLEANSELLLIERRNEMLSGLAENHLMQLKPSGLVNGFGLMNDSRQIINQSVFEKERRNELLIRQNELLARQHAMVDPKHYLPSSSIPLESNELLGANIHHNQLPPFGMRIESSTPPQLSANPLTNSLSSKNLTVNNLTGNPMGIPNLPMNVNGLAANNIGVNSLLNSNSMGINSLANNSLGLNQMQNSFGVNPMGVNSLGVNSLNPNPMGVNHLGMNSLNGSSMGVNSLAANEMGMKSLAANQMGVNSLTNSLGVNSLASSLGVNSMTSNGMGVNPLQNSSFMMQNPHLLHNRQQSELVNGFDSPSQTTEVRYGASNMDKFFTDFHKAQQLRQESGGDRRHTHSDWLDLIHKQRTNNNRPETNSRAAGDADDDLDFDPFKETQKALAEMMESEMMENNVNHSENLERVRRLPPPGFSHMNSFGIGVPRAHTHVPSYSTQSAMYSDWTQMDPAIMSTSVSFNKPLTHHDLLSRFSQLSMRPSGPQNNPSWPPRGFNPTNMPPGFTSPQTQQHSAECSAK